MNRLSLQFAAGHPCAAGHFPGNPIIPGALLLAEVLQAIAQAEQQQFSACNVRNAKFLHPARPGDRVEIEYQRSAQGTIEFQCDVGGIKVLSGAASVPA